MSSSTNSKTGLAVVAVAAAGAAYWLWQRLGLMKSSDAPAAAFAGSGAHKDAFVHTRDAGPENARDEEGHDWDKLDQSSDESFPSSDPPAQHDFRTPEPIDYPKD